ncbi:hypothetical protein PS9374_04754 [Planomonospora sphaerica]|uniref:Uncharacterized protein n=1 Tax=Planomonospora sphaerica TaxID=161355 RepID=A0A171DJU9_9ACTN|nr:hypothetical protein [Planomonospora sphaerica]GAT69087.1 hypothetical protein PS9374_04754 [Planomonospora sphaerica]
MGMPWLPDDFIANVELARADSPATPHKLEGFPPYAAYVARNKEIEELISLTSISYELSQQLLFSTPPEQLADITFGEVTPEHWSYSMADIAFKSTPEMSAAWLRYEEYAEHMDATPQEIADQAKAGLLGPVLVHPSDGAPIILWPPENERAADFEAPDPGVYHFRMEANLTADCEVDLAFDLSDPAQLEAARKHYLKMASSLGNVSEVAKRAEFLLFRAAFLLQWTSFEVFLRETIEELLTRHPQVILESAGKKESLTYEQLFSMTNKLSTIESLRQELIDMEIERLRSNGRSIHGMLNFLKSAFRFKRDPYQAWYVYKGERRQASYNTLIEIKERRNLLVHEASNNGSTTSGEEEQKLSNEDYMKYVLTLRSVAYSVSSSVHYKKYEV